MGLVQDVYTLVTQGIQHSLHADVIAELPRFLHDLAVGPRHGPKRVDNMYMDLHAHFAPDASLKEIVDGAVKRVDILAITEWSRDEPPPPHLNFRDAREKLEREGVRHDVLGDTLVRAYSSEGLPLLLCEGHETYSKENQGIVLVGTQRRFGHQSMTVDEIAEIATDNGELWFPDHMASVGASGIGFRYPTRKELRWKEQLLDRYRPPVETDNLQNTLWMFPGNLLMRRLADRYECTHLGNSDTKFGIPEIGGSRTVTARNSIDDSSERAFYNSVCITLSSEHRHDVRVEHGYASIVNFLRYQVEGRLK